MIPHRGSSAGMAALLLLVTLPGALRAQRGEDAPTPGPDRSTAWSIPAGTRIEARLDAAIDAAHSRIGDRFTARVTAPSVAMNRGMRIPAGAIITGTIVGLQRAHTSLAPAFVRLTIESVAFGGQKHPMHATVEGTKVVAEADQQGSAPVRRRAFPGIAPGSVLIGVNGSGAAKGSFISLGTVDGALRLPSGTLLDLRVN